MSSIKWLIILTILGGLLRFYDLTKNPISLNTDEVTFAYNAYSVLKTARDEYGVFLPITFKSVGDYKNPVPTYLLVPSIAVFGLNEFGVRFPFAAIGTLAIPLFYFLSLELTKNKKIALITALFVAISPWHLFYSRFGSDQQMAMVIFTFGMLMFLKMLESKKKIYPILASIFMIGAMYTYYVARVFVPLITLSLIIIYFPKLKTNFSKTLLFLILAGILTLPLILRSLFGPDLARGNMVFIAKDIEYRRYVILDDPNPGIIDNLALVFLIGQRYLNYFSADFLFFNGLNMTQTGSLGLGIMYLFDLPFLILGIWQILKWKNKHKYLIFAWLLLAFLPASFTNNEQNPSRTIIALFPLLLINSFGSTWLIELVQGIRQKNLRAAIYLGSTLVISITLLHAYLVFAVHFPYDRGEFSFEGNKPAVQFALDHYSEYDQIVFDPIRGTQSPDIFGLPHAYILFYGAYDPSIYQTEPKDFKGIFGFDKYRIRSIDWPHDRYSKGTLFIGSPWSLPIGDLKPEEILKKIYLSNGQLIYYIVTPKPNN